MPITVNELRVRIAVDRATHGEVVQRQADAMAPTAAPVGITSPPDALVQACVRQVLQELAASPAMAWLLDPQRWSQTCADRVLRELERGQER